MRPDGCFSPCRKILRGKNCLHSSAGPAGRRIRSRHDGFPPLSASRRADLPLCTISRNFVLIPAEQRDPQTDPVVSEDTSPERNCRECCSCCFFSPRVNFRGRPFCGVPQDPARRKAVPRPARGIRHSACPAACFPLQGGRDPRPDPWNSGLHTHFPACPGLHGALPPGAVPDKASRRQRAPLRESPQLSGPARADHTPPDRADHRIPDRGLCPKRSVRQRLCHFYSVYYLFVAEPSVPSSTSVLQPQKETVLCSQRSSLAAL